MDLNRRLEYGQTAGEGAQTVAQMLVNCQSKLSLLEGLNCGQVTLAKISESLVMEDLRVQLDRR